MGLPPDDIIQMIPWLTRQKAEQERRNRNRRREGRIVAENTENGLYRVRFREAGAGVAAFDSPWLPVRAISSGGLKIQAEPTVGQWVEVVSESGDMRDGVIEMSAYHDEARRPHTKNGELAVSVGGYRSVIDKAGTEATTAKSRTHETEGDVVYRTGGVVRFE